MSSAYVCCQGIKQIGIYLFIDAIIKSDLLAIYLLSCLITVVANLPLIRSQAILSAVMADEMYCEFIIYIAKGNSNLRHQRSRQ